MNCLSLNDETDIASKAISGRIGIGLEISRRGYAKSTFGAIITDSKNEMIVRIFILVLLVHVVC